jgi:hypothetical protein
VIKPVKFCHVNLPSPSDTEVEKLTWDDYFLRTAPLVQIYSMPFDVVTKLANIAAEINSSKFARYMASRGHWPLHRRFGGLQVLLHWWGATSPAFMKDYASAVCLGSYNADDLTRQVLRLDVRNLLRMDTDPAQEGYEAGLDVVISRGIEEVARLRRELHVVIQDAFEELVARAQVMGVGVYHDPLPSGSE